MGALWLAQVRLMHLVILGLTLLSVIIYALYITTPQLSTTVSPGPVKIVELIGAPVQPLFNNSSIVAPPEKNVQQMLLGQSPGPNQSSEAPKPGKNGQPDVMRGVAAESIYEGGHVDETSQICADYGRELKLLIIITSAPSHEPARMAIRETWGHYAMRRDVAIAFMLGSIANATINANIDKEQFQFGDIIRGRFVDTYDHLTLKTISMLEWVDRYCHNAAFVLKTDDDMFINVPRLLNFIDNHNVEQRAIYGRLAKKWKPIRNKKSKYYISPAQYKPAIFPDFTTGPAYLLPARIAKELYEAALNYTYFKLEDVFITGIVADGLKIKRLHAAEFLNKRISLTPCSVQKGISIHMIKGQEQYDIWKKLHDQTTKCKK